MPDSCKAETYRARAQRWRQEAETHPGRERDACLVIATAMPISLH